jgi:allantoate deiminase
MERCEVLGRCSEEADRLTRPFATAAMRDAHQHVQGWMREAGMRTRVDNVGNIRGRYEGVSHDGPTLLLGSHLDSVRGAGKYDGPLGVMVAIAAVRRLHRATARLPFAIEVIGFADEEGLRFGSTYLGSRAVAGTFDQADLDRRDAGGTSMAQAIASFGGDPTLVAEDRWNEGPLLGYCEVHIEQGPVLEAEGVAVGVVSAITGQNRYVLNFSGEAGHAGTVPMHSRRDALAAAAEFVVAVEREARDNHGLVATVGQLSVEPGAANVIPGRVELSLDVRHADDSMLAAASERILGHAARIADARQVPVSIQARGKHPAMPCSPRLVRLLSRAVAELGLPEVQLDSGAGHDGVALSSLTEIGMLFVRCRGGISHHPSESVSEEDVAVALDVLTRFLELLTQPA